MILRLSAKYKLIVKEITIDNGFKFNKISLLVKLLKCAIYFCDPHALIKEIQSEHIGSIIRIFYKKDTNFSLMIDEEI